VDLRGFFRGKAGGQIARNMIARGNRARDAGDYSKAAASYEEALRIKPDNAAIHVQCGHMLKETGDLANAERHYLEAHRLMPNDADLALQFGHFYKVAGQLSRAAEAYRRALELKPYWEEPARELEQLTGSIDGILNLDAYLPASENAETISRLVPELAPREPKALRRIFVEGIHIRRLGSRRERTPWGVLPTLRGVQAIRGFCISSSPIGDFKIAVDGRIIHEVPLEGYSVEGGPPNQRKYVFNVWHDFSGFGFGRHTVELRFCKQKKQDAFAARAGRHRGTVTRSSVPGV
jgi:tetratricopeptide (TPR) repeat protein